MTDPRDKEWINDVKQGKVKSFENLVLKYQDMIYSFVYNMVQNEMDAEEITQDVFVKAYRKLDLFRGESKFSTWLFSIAHNTAASSFRKKKLKTSSVEDAVSAENTFVELEGAIDNLQSEERNRFIGLALEKLAPQQKLLIQLFYLEEQSIKEIEGITGLKAGSIKTGLMRGRNKLFSVLTETMGISNHQLL